MLTGEPTVSDGCLHSVTLRYGLAVIPLSTILLPTIGVAEEQSIRQVPTQMSIAPASLGLLGVSSRGLLCFESPVRPTGRLETMEISDWMPRPIDLAPSQRTYTNS